MFEHSAQPRVIAITGSTRGLGRALAYNFAQAGWHVIIHGRSAEACQQTAVQIEQATGQHVYWLDADFSQMEEVARFCEQIGVRTPFPDIFINNAAEGPTPAPFPTGKAYPRRDPHDQIITTNCLAPYLIFRRLFVRLGITLLSPAMPALDETRFFSRTRSLALTYGQSKTALSLVMQHLARTTASVFLGINPGRLLKTDMTANLLAALPAPLRLYYQLQTLLSPAVTRVARNIVNFTHRHDLGQYKGHILSLTKSGQPRASYEPAYDPFLVNRLMAWMDEHVSPFSPAPLNNFSLAMESPHAP